MIPKTMYTEKHTPQITLFGTLGCHLCEDALALIHLALPQGININKVDIVEQPELLDSMSERIPVMSIGSVELNWPFSQQDIESVWQKQTSQRRYLL